MKLIVGLGNREARYQNTRHNVGFLFLDYFLNIEQQSETTFSTVGTISNKFILNSVDLRTFRTSGYMNNSGMPVQLAMNYYKIEPKDLIVIHDEIDLGFGEVKSKFGGGDNGHNGLRSITKELGTNEYNRIRFGVGRPNRGDVANFVLSNFTKEEMSLLEDNFIEAQKLIETLL